MPTALNDNPLPNAPPASTAVEHALAIVEDQFQIVFSPDTKKLSHVSRGPEEQSS